MFLARFTRFYYTPLTVQIAVERFRNNQQPVTVHCQTGLKLTHANALHMQQHLCMRNYLYIIEDIVIYVNQLLILSLLSVYNIYA